MSVVSKLTFIPFTPNGDDGDDAPQMYHSNRDQFRGELRGGLNAKFGEPPSITPSSSLDHAEVASSVEKVEVSSSTASGLPPCGRPSVSYANRWKRPTPNVCVGNSAVPGPSPSARADELVRSCCRVSFRLSS